MARNAVRKAERGTVVGDGAIDYVTLTTYSGDVYSGWRDIVEQMRGDRAVGGGMLYGYTMERIGDMQIGEGIQDKQPHFLVSIAGHEADEFMRLLITTATVDIDAINCSRLDVQLTVPKQREVRLSYLAQQYQEGQLGEFNGRGRPKVYAYAGNDGDTLYIGSTSSEKVIRFYDKPILLKGRRQVYERMEVQLRNKKALALLKRIIKAQPNYARATILQYIKTEFNRLPDGLQLSLSVNPYLEDIVGSELKAETTEPEEDRKLRWLKSCRKTFIEIASRQDATGQQARELFLEVLATGTVTGPLVAWMDYRLIGPDGDLWTILDVSQE